MRLPTQPVLLAVWILGASAGDFCYTPTYCVKVGFCNDLAHPEVLDAQPAVQGERWQRPKLNQTHCLTSWRPVPQLCGETRTSYVLTMNSTSPLLNTMTSLFGGFPQDACAPGSAALQELQQDSPCSTFRSVNCTDVVTEKVISINSYVWEAFRLAPLNLTVGIMAHAKLKPSKAHRQAVTVPLWCLAMRKYNPQQLSQPPSRQPFGHPFGQPFGQPFPGGAFPPRRRPVKRWTRGPPGFPGQQPFRPGPGAWAGPGAPFNQGSPFSGGRGFP